MEAEAWIMQVEKIFRAMDCLAEQHMALTTYVLEGEADVWWTMQSVCWWQER